MGVGAGLYMCDVVKKFTFAISSPDEFLYKRSPKKVTGSNHRPDLTVPKSSPKKAVFVTLNVHL